jgi:uncharacterized RDD family membrane protein YckC
MAEHQAISVANESEIIPCGFWKRPFALLIDSLILGLVGFVSGIFLFDFYVSLGPAGRLLGIAVAIPYFCWFNSELGNGQTPGKRLLNIKLVDRNGQCLSLQKTFLRSLILLVPYFLNGATLPEHGWVTYASHISGFMVFSVGFCILYLYLSNRKTRQSLHDLAVSSYVVEKETHGIFKQSIWKGYLVICVITAITIEGLLNYGVSKLSKIEMFESLIDLRSEIQKLEYVRNSGVSDRFNNFNGNKSRQLAITLILRNKLSNDEKEFLEVAEIVLEHFSEIDERDTLMISGVYGYDIGIASGNFSQVRFNTPDQWREKILESK